MPPRKKKRRRGRRAGTFTSESTNLTSAATDLTYIDTGNLSDTLDTSLEMTSQRSRAPRGGARAGPLDTGEEVQLWNETQEKLLKLDRNESRATELRKEIFEKEASMKLQEDAGTSRQAHFLATTPLILYRAIH